MTPLLLPSEHRTVDDLLARQAACHRPPRQRVNGAAPTHTTWTTPEENTPPDADYWRTQLLPHHFEPASMRGATAPQPLTQPTAHGPGASQHHPPPAP
ncbi:hypothetical protein ACH4UM_37395 [Streptomyces sp. NPDC020801]|uniref:hypothetical protein n=1 Tax=unclassified Streptomyces TaxID=2593676 RepID=UPI00378C9BB1